MLQEHLPATLHCTGGRACRMYKPRSPRLISRWGEANTDLIWLLGFHLMHPRLRIIVLCDTKPTDSVRMTILLITFHSMCVLVFWDNLLVAWVPTFISSLFNHFWLKKKRKRRRETEVGGQLLLLQELLEKSEQCQRSLMQILANGRARIPPENHPGPLLPPASPQRSRCSAGKKL